MKKDLLIFTYADKNYDFFVVPYIYFALNSNPDCFVEVAVEDINTFITNNSEAIEKLKGLYGANFLIRQSNALSKYPNATPNVIRFIEEPINTSKYVYIGDIDLLIFENIKSVHLDYINKYGLPFSNIIRDSSVSNPRLTGLHFCQFDRMYPLPDISDLDLKLLNDEHVLYLIMKRKGFMVPDSFRERPECGIHLSLSRDSLGRYTGTRDSNFKVEKSAKWPVETYKERFLKSITDEKFKEIYFLLPYEFRLIHMTLESVITDKSRLLHRTAVSHMVDKRLMFDEVLIAKDDLYKSRANALQESDTTTASHITTTMNLLWPNNIDIWYKKMWLAFSTGRQDLALECFLHILDLPKGYDFLKDSKILEKKVKFINENIILKNKLASFENIEPQNDNDIVFLCGGGHSGTTLMLAVLDSNNSIQSIPHETGVFHRNKNDKKVIEEISKWKVKYNISATVNKYVEKTPVHGAHIERILKLYPKSKVIFMVRDGRDATLSEMKRLGNYDDAIKSWLKINTKASHFFNDSRVLVVKYEDLVSDLKSTCLKVCDFLGVNYSESMLTYYENQRTWWDKEVKKADSSKELVGENHKVNRNWQINQPIFKSKNNWKESMTEEQKKLFKTKANHMLISLGYAQDELW